MKLRKGDWILIRQYHAATAIHGGSTRYATWHLAQVSAATRDGKAKQAILAGSLAPIRPQSACSQVLADEYVLYGASGVDCDAAIASGAQEWDTFDEAKSALAEFRR